MIRNLLFSSSRRIVNVMSVKAQSQKPVRVATFNILAPCYNWIRYVSAADEKVLPLALVNYHNSLL